MSGLMIGLIAVIALVVMFGGLVLAVFATMMLGAVLYWMLGGVVTVSLKTTTLTGEKITEIRKYRWLTRVA